MSYDVTYQRHAQYSKTREHLIEYFDKVLCIHNRPYLPSWNITDVGWFPTTASSSRIL